jgi:hypothetical protein
VEAELLSLLKDMQVRFLRISGCWRVSDLGVLDGRTCVCRAKNYGICVWKAGAQMPSNNTLLKFAKTTRSRPIIKLLAT